MELKKVDLFDLGILLVITATGGLDVISEEVLTQLGSFNKTCCVIHAIMNYESPPKQKKSIIAAQRILSRLSSGA